MRASFEKPSRLAGTVRVPGDKSIAHRALILGAMRSGDSVLRGCPSGGDVLSTAGCLRSLGVEVQMDGDAFRVPGKSWRPPNSASLYAGNSGTSMRLLAGACAGRPGRFEFGGDESLSRRPMNRIAEPLRQMGATVELSEGDFAPFTVTGGHLRGIHFLSTIPSAQIKGAVLLAALQAEGSSQFEEPQASRDHTERLLKWLGAGIDSAGPMHVLHPDLGFFEGEGFDLAIPGDFSSAAYFLAAAFLVTSSDLVLEGVGLNPSRMGFLDVASEMGARFEVELEEAEPEPFGVVRASHSELNATDVGGSLIPNVIDEIPLIALMATQAEGVTRIRDAEELRVKETDRIAAIAVGLRQLGAQIEEESDGLTITGPTPLSGGSVDVAGDHRIALTFAVAGLISKDPVEVRDWESSRVSYPDFAEDLRALWR